MSALALTLCCAGLPGQTPAPFPPPAPAAVAATGLAGVWTGTAREQVDGAGALEYPVELRFTGGDGALQLRVQAKVAVPTDSGERLTVTIDATYRGICRDGALRMKSERIDVRVQQTGEQIPTEPQQLTGRRKGDELSGRVGNDDEGWTTFVVKRVVEPSATAGRSEPGAPAAVGVTAAPARHGTLVLERTEILDPRMGGIASHTMMVPRGWRFEGGVRWLMQPNNYVHFVGELRAPGGESVLFDMDRLFTWVQNPMPGMPPPRPGEAGADNSILRPVPQRPGEVAVDVVLRSLAPDATAVQLVDARIEPAISEALRAKVKPQFDLLEQNNRQSDAPGNLLRMRVEPWAHAERARLRYRAGGSEQEADVVCSLIGYRTTSTSELAVLTHDSWVVADVRMARTATGELDACLPVLRTVAGTLKETPRWSAALHEIRMALMEAQTRSLRAGLEEMIRRGQRAVADRAELSDQQMRSWRERQDSSDRIHKATIDSIRGTHDFRASDGHVHSVTNLYDRAFANGQDTLILTNDPNYRPAADPALSRVTWEELQRVDPLRREQR